MDTDNKILRALGRIEGELVEIRKLSALPFRAQLPVWRTRRARIDHVWSGDRKDPADGANPVDAWLDSL